MMFHYTEESRSIFVKVPLQGEPMYHSVNARELTMLKVVSIEHFEPKYALIMMEFCYFAGGTSEAADVFGYQGMVGSQ